MIKAFKATLAYLSLKIFIWSGGKDIIAASVNELLAKNKVDSPKIPVQQPEGVSMMQNQHLAGILLAMGCPPKEAEIRSEIFGFKDMPVIEDKLYFFKSSYWIDV